MERNTGFTTGRLIVEAARGRIPAFVETGLNVVHVDDVAEGHLLALDKGKVGERYVLGGRDMSLSEILAEIAALAGRRPPRLRLPHGAVLPVAVLAEAWARLAGGPEPFVTVAGVRMARKRMFFSSAKAARELGYRARPAEAPDRRKSGADICNRYLGSASESAQRADLHDRQLPELCWGFHPWNWQRGHRLLDRPAGRNVRGWCLHPPPVQFVARSV